MRLSPLAVVLPLLLAACAPQGEDVTPDDLPSSAAMSEAESEADSSVTTIDVSSEAASQAAATPPAPVPPAEMPSKVALDVPFASQAPLGNWDMPYQEACEEASLILVNRFLGEQGITPQEMDAAILAMVDWQTNNNMGADITAAQMVETAEGFLNRNATVYYDGDVTIASIEAELAKGNPVVLPLAGRDLNNPYFSGGGPWYHVLVVTGYDSKNFITNDVGTKRGESYKYPKQVLYDAIHDWTGVKEDIRSGRKAMVVVTK